MYQCGEMLLMRETGPRSAHAIGGIDGFAINSTFDMRVLCGAPSSAAFHHTGTHIHSHYPDQRACHSIFKHTALLANTK